MEKSDNLKFGLFGSVPDKSNRKTKENPF
ncbi:hypothetical protein B14911_07063 [Bacillus sp. NRRL B-14911]|nr:hypothetical protein B14911_07063 [Bacillus sp. NRRL B-14911]